MYIINKLKYFQAKTKTLKDQILNHFLQSLEPFSQTQLVQLAKAKKMLEVDDFILKRFQLPNLSWGECHKFYCSIVFISFRNHQFNSIRNFIQQSTLPSNYSDQFTDVKRLFRAVVSLHSKHFAFLFYYIQFCYRIFCLDVCIPKTKTLPKCFQSKQDQRSSSPEPLWLLWNLDCNSLTLKTQLFCVERREMDKTLQRVVGIACSSLSKSWVVFLQMGYQSRADYHNLFEKIGMELTQPIGNAPQIKHAKNMNFQGSLSPSLENQIFSVSQCQHQKYGLFVFSSIPTSEFNSLNYRIRSNLLAGSPISELNRAKLRAWLYEEAANMKLSRQLCALAGTYIDLYLARGGLVKLQQFQTFGIACLRLANKLTDDATIGIDYSVFPKSKVLEWEEKICVKLQFRLNPITFVQVINALVVSWNRFAQRHDLWSYNINVGNSANKRTYDCIQMFEIMDFLTLKLKSVGFAKGALQLEVFKLVNRVSYEKQKKLQSLSIEDEVLISFWTNPEEEILSRSSFETITQRFESFIAQYQPWIKRIASEERKQTESWAKSLLSQETQLTSSKDIDRSSKIWTQTFFASWMNNKKKVTNPQRSSSQRKSSTDTNI